MQWAARCTSSTINGVCATSGHSWRCRARTSMWHALGNGSHTGCWAPACHSMSCACSSCNDASRSSSCGEIVVVCGKQCSTCGVVLKNKKLRMVVDLDPPRYTHNTHAHAQYRTVSTMPGCSALVAAHKGSCALRKVGALTSTPRLTIACTTYALPAVTAVSNSCASS